MNKSRRKFLEKGPSIALAAGVGVASGQIAMASPGSGLDGTRPLLDTVIANQRKINGLLYYSNHLMLEVLSALIENPSGIDLVEAQAKLSEAAGYLYTVPGEFPPGCEPPPGGGAGGGGGG